MANRYGDSADSIKQHIKRIVAAYKVNHAEEYNLVKQDIAMRRELMRDPKFAQLEGSEHRALFEIPETLSHMLIVGLDPDQTAWFKTIPGARWFARTFREFSLPSEI